MDNWNHEDILGGVQMGYSTVRVLTGSTRRQDQQRFAYSPDFIAESIADLAEYVFIEKIRTKTHDLRSSSRDLAIVSSRKAAAGFSPIASSSAGLGLAAS